MGKKVFISYAREDLEHAKKLHVDLKSAGHDPWLDDDDLLAGQNWRQTILKKIQESDYVILLLSTRSVVKRGFVQVEQKRALRVLEEFPDSDIFVIPVRLDECELPYSLENLHFVDLFPNYETGLDKILKSLNAERLSDKPTSPPPPVSPSESLPPNIYLSYAAIDNDTGWVNGFADHLESQVRKRIGREDAFTLVIDRKVVDESPELPPKIIKTIEQSSILVSLTSPGYVNSDRCERELNTFLRANENRQDAQVFIVELETPDAEAIPDRLKRERPRQFWKKDNEGFPFVLESSHPQYAVLINRLSHELADAVRCVEPVLVDTPPSDVNNECRSEISDDRPPVFLAEVTENLLQLRDEVEAYLEQAGLRVVPKNPLPTTDADAFEKAVTDALAPCRVFVQLLDGNSGKSRALPSGICRPQAECAEKAGKTVLQWRDTGLDEKKAADTDQQSLLTGKNVVSDDIEIFKKQIYRHAVLTTSEIQFPEAKVGFTVFLNANHKDESHARDVEKVMLQHNIGCALPAWGAESSEMIKDMRYFILNAEGLIVIYGDVDSVWVRKQLWKCNNLIFSRERPMNAWAVYESPPPEKAGINFSVPGLHVINCRNGMNEKKFLPFLEALVKGGQK